MEAGIARGLMHQPDVGRPVRFIRSPFFWKAKGGVDISTRLSYSRRSTPAAFNGHARRGFANKLRDAHGIETSNAVGTQKL